MPEPSNTKSFDAKVSYPLSKKLSKLLHKNKNMTANKITLFRPVFLTTFIYTLNKSQYYPSLISLLSIIFIGCLDGTYARMYNQTSYYGKELNHGMSWLSSTIIGEALLYKKSKLLSILFLKRRIKNKKKISSGIKSLHYCIKNKPEMNESVKIKSMGYRPTGNINDNLMLITYLMYPFIYKLYSKPVNKKFPFIL